MVRRRFGVVKTREALDVEFPDFRAGAKVDILILLSGLSDEQAIRPVVEHQRGFSDVNCFRPAPQSPWDQREVVQIDSFSPQTLF